MRRLRTLFAVAAVFASGLPSIVSAQASFSAYTSWTRYDIERRVVGTIAPSANGAATGGFLAVRNTYDAEGLLTKVERGRLTSYQPDTIAPSAWTGFTVFQTVDTTYDADDRKLSETLSSGGVAETRTQWKYDNIDRVVCTVVRMKKASNFATAPADACTLDPTSTDPDRITKTLYDLAGRVSVVQKAYATPLQQDYVAYTYTPNSKPLTVTDANGGTAQYSYDSLDRMARWYFPSKTEAGVASTTDYEEYAYDANGNRTSLRKRDGQIITYAYDTRNRQFQKRLPGGDPSNNCAGLASDLNDVCTSYDNRGLMTAARFGGDNGEGVLSEYDGIGRQTASTTTLDGTSRRISYIWQDDNKRSSVIHPDGSNFIYRYDYMDRFTEIRPNGYPTGGVQIAYDIQGRTATLTRPGTVVSYDYDTIGRIGTLIDDKMGAAGDLTTIFAYSPASQIVSRARDNDSFVYAGDVTLARQYSVNGLNQYLTSGPATLTYDGNGNLTSETSGGTTKTYDYDAENRLIKRSTAYPPCPKDAQCQQQSDWANLRYDPLGRLYEVSAQVWGTTRFLYDGDELVAEYDTYGNVMRRYAHGPGEDDPLLWYEGGDLSNRRQLFSDHQGSIVAVADANGNPIAINTYDDWGIPGISNNSISNNGRFQYTGQVWLPEIGMYYYKARIYSPTLGRFLQTDPIGYGDQQNLYAYVGNDPGNGRDPTGLYSCENPKDCDRIEGQRQQIIRSAGTYQLNAPERRLLLNLAKFLGAKGVDNGISIKIGKPETPGAAGETSGTAGSIAITLARGQSLSEGAVTLAHEATHGVQRWVGGESKTWDQQFERERQASSVEGMVGRGLNYRSVGSAATGLRMWGDPGFNSAARAGASASCNAAQIADYNNNSWERSSKGGSCPMR